MPYVSYNKVTGSHTGPRQTIKDGWKLVPHVKSLRLNKPYSLADYIYLDGNTDVVGLMSGGTLWGEFVPDPQLRGSVSSNSGWTFGSDGNGAYARAYAKFRSKVYTKASNLTAIKERGKTISMIQSRLQQLVKGANALKKGRFKEFLRTFGVKPLPKDAHRKWSRPKQFGGLWLEYWMGWAPTVGDVYNTLEFLGKPIPDDSVRAGSRAPMSGVKIQTSGNSKAFSYWDGHCTVNIKAKVVVTNPSLYNLQGLGLINPAQTVWETIPFSWFVDWFTNVGQVLGQLTDWVGLQLKDLVVSCKTDLQTRYSVTNAKAIFGATKPNFIYRNRRLCFFSRMTGGSLPVVRPTIGLPDGLSLTRGATLVSLLCTIFAPAKAKTLLKH